MTIRERVEQAIRGADTPEAAAMDVCIMLEGLVDLAGNGWFDDDPELLRRLGD